MHRSSKYVVEVTVGEACIYQGNCLILFLIRRGDPPVRTCVTRIRTPRKLHRTEGEQRETTKKMQKVTRLRYINRGVNTRKRHTLYFTRNVKR